MGFDALHDCVTVVALVDDDVAWQKDPHVQRQRERPMREGRVARAEDLVTPEIDAELVLECLRDVDLGEDPEALALERVGELGECLVVARCEVLLQCGFHVGENLRSR